MKLSTRGRYATRALIDLALNQGERPVQMREIARRQQLSQPYLERLVPPLVAAGILRSARGARGGISLARPTANIAIAEVIQAVEGPIIFSDCVQSPQICPNSKTCAARGLWLRVTKGMNDTLSATTLKDLVDRQKNAKKEGAKMYHI